MKVSLNWAQFYAGGVDLKSISVDELLHKIGTQLGAVEEIEYWGTKYDGIVVARVVSCEKHPDADKLHVCRIDDGGTVKDVERGDDGLVQVVCGAPNVEAGMTVAWLPPGAIVPSTLDKEPFVLEVRDIRGQKSNGMLASLAELGISDNHDGILSISSEEVGAELLKPGTEFKKLYGLDDVVIDMENKMFTHRPDCFGIIGVARELAGITGQKFTSPDWYKQALNNPQQSTLPFVSQNEVADLVPRFTAQVVENVSHKPSPIWLQAGLTRAGIRPINNIVDLTNYFMQLTAQPTHAFDYDKIKAVSGGKPTIFPRMAEDGEELELLGGKRLKLTKDDVVIATDKQAVALAGVMGGAATEVDENTKNIIIECATFDMYAVRRTCMRHGLFTDAATRFTKGQSSLQNAVVLAKLVKDLTEQSDAKAGLLFDSRPDAIPISPVNVSSSFINTRLGSKLSVEDMAKFLEDVEIVAHTNDENLEIHPPYWRTDLEIPEDIVEEVGRLYGYDKLPLELPKRTTRPAALNSIIETKDHIREVLSGAGANELLTYSFVHGNLIDKVGQDRSLAYQLSNALSPDLQYYRLSMTPSLLEKVQPNLRSDMIRSEDNEFALFEIGKAHVKGQTDPDNPNLPKELHALSLVFAADDKTANRKYNGAAYYQAKHYLNYLMTSLRALDVLIFEALEGAELNNNPWAEQLVKPYEPKRSAILRNEQGIWGVIGEFKNSVRQSLKLPAFSAGFELDPLFFVLHKPLAKYVPLPKFPKVQQDITLKVPVGLGYSELFTFLWQELSNVSGDATLPILKPIGIYQSEEDKTHKNVTFRLWLSAYGRTLTADEVNKLLDDLALKSHEKFGADRL